MPRSRPESVALFGAGRVGTVVTRLLADAGHPVCGVASRRSTSAAQAAGVLGAPVVDDPAKLAAAADIVLVAVPEGAIESADRAIAPGLRPGTFVCHFSGVSGTLALRASAKRGAEVAALHPVQSIVDVDRAVSAMKGVAWGVTCDDDLYPRAAALVEEMSGLPVRVAEEDRIVWHAAAAITSNGLSALVAVSESLLSQIGVPDVLQVLTPLARGTVDNIAHSSSAVDALTGPVIRAESSTIRRHIEALMRLDEGLARSYERITRAILDVATADGRLTDDDRSAVDKALAS